MGTLIRKNDKVVVLRGEASFLRGLDGKAVQGTVIEVDRDAEKALIEFPRPKVARGERERPVRGLEVYKSVRYNQKTGEMGGLKIIKRPVPLCNLSLVCPKCGGRKFRREVVKAEGEKKQVSRVCKKKECGHKL